MKARSLSVFLCMMFSTFTRVIGVRHIVFILADDLGWNDVGFHNPDMVTPNIDKLASEGVILNSSYVQPLCTPSRHSIMTGTYPFKHGMQRGVLIPNVGKCAPLDLDFLPQRLKKLGYETHMVGKWHLGFCNMNCTPTYRGFDTFLGYYNGMEDYYTKEIANGIDFNNNLTPIKNDEYSAFVYAKRAVDIINKHDPKVPLFLYLPFQSVHGPLQVPKRFENLYPNIQDQGRKTYSGMVSALDEAIGNITGALETSGLYKDTLIIFSADNGGIPMASGNNYPLRGAKGTIFEGGTRATAFVHGAGLRKKGYKYEGIMHAVDWHATVVRAAGGEPVSGIDGMNQWDSISTGTESARNEFIYNLDNIQEGSQGHAAIRVGDYKLIDGYPGRLSGWYKPEQVHVDNDYIPEELQAHTLYYKRNSKYTVRSKRSRYDGEGLYNLKDDPNEHVDLSDKHPDIVKELKAKLAEYRKSLVPPPEIPVNPDSDPSKHNGFWVPGWC